MAVVDFLNNAQRVDIMPQPLWLSSKQIGFADIKSSTLVLFAFKKGAYVVHDIYLEVLSAIAGTSGVDVSIHTTPIPAELATPQNTYDGVSLSNTSVMVSDISANGLATLASPVCLIEATDNVVISVAEDDAGTASGGVFRVHVLVSKVPTVSI